jgi:hypothetical protein
MVKNQLFSVVKEKLSSEDGAEVFQMSFSKEGFEKNISIIFYAESEPNEDQFFLFVEKNGGNVDIEGYLGLIGFINKRDNLDLDTYSGTYEERVVEVIRFLEKTYESHWKDILVGNKWPDVPVDFSDYK